MSTLLSNNSCPGVFDASPGSLRGSVLEMSVMLTLFQGSKRKESFSVVIDSNSTRDQCSRQLRCPNRLWEHWVPRAMASIADTPGQSPDLGDSPHMRKAWSCSLHCWLRRQEPHQSGYLLFIITGWERSVQTGITLISPASFPSPWMCITISTEVKKKTSFAILKIPLHKILFS